MPSSSILLRSLLTAGLLFGSANAYCQTVVDDNRLAAGYYSRQQWPESIELFRDLIARYPESLEASVAHFYLGEAHMQTDDFQNAYREFQQYLVKHPGSEMSARALFRMGESAYHLQHDATAIRLLEEFVQRNPNHDLLEFALPYLGELRLRKVEPQLASRVFEASLKQHPRGKLVDQAIFGLAKAYQLAGQPQKAINAFQRAADNEYHPLAAEADIQIAFIFMGQQELDSAREHLLRALNSALEPEVSTEAGYWLARLLIEEGEHQTALDLLEPLIGQPATEKVGAALCYDAALTAHRLNRPDQALEWLQEFKVNYPQSELADAALHLNIDITSAHSDPAVQNTTSELWQRFVRDFPNSRWKPSVMEKVGRFHYSKQDFTSAAALFEELLRANQFMDPSRTTLDRDNWLYLSALSHIGVRDFVAAEANLAKINVVTASEEIRGLSQLALATARFGQKKYQSAIPGYQAYLGAVELTQSSDRVQLLRARQELTLCLAESDMWVQANDQFKILLKEHGEDPIVNQTAEYLAGRAVDTGHGAAAVEILERLVVSSPNTTKRSLYLSHLGWIKYEAGEQSQACELFRRLIDEFPDNSLAGPAAMCLAKCYDDRQQHDRAAQQYGWVREHFRQTDYGKLATLRRAHSLINAEDKTHFPEAESLLIEYLAQTTAPAAQDEALFQLGWVANALGKTSESRAAYQRLMAECPNSKYRPDAILRLAQSHLSEGQFDLASQQLKLLADDSGLPTSLHVRMLFLRGEIASRQSRWSEVSVAMEELLAEVDQLSARVKAEYWLGESAFRQADFQAAIKHFEFVQTNHAELMPTLQPWIWLRLAQSHGKLEKWQTAGPVAEDGRKRFPDFSSRFEFDFVVARSLEAQGLLADARVLYEQVVQSPEGGRSETAAIAQWRIGEIHFHLEDHAEAIQAYYLVDSNYAYPQWRSAALLQAGKCQEHLGNWEQAQKLYSRLIELFPHSEHCSTAENRLSGVLAHLPRDKPLKQVKAPLKSTNSSSSKSNKK